jgi:hypothetical protein
MKYFTGIDVSLRSVSAKRGFSYTEYDESPDGMAAFVQASGRSAPLLVASGASIAGYAPGSSDRILSSPRK